MNDFTKLIIAVIAIASLFIIGWMADQKKPQVITYLPVEDLRIKNIQEETPPAQQPEVDCPQPKANPINSTGIIVPGTAAYTLKLGRLVKVGKLVEKALNCIIIKEIDKDFYLVVIIEDGYKNDRWIVNKKDVKIIDKVW